MVHARVAIRKCVTFFVYAMRCRAHGRALVTRHYATEWSAQQHRDLSRVDMQMRYSRAVVVVGIRARVKSEITHTPRTHAGITIHIHTSDAHVTAQNRNPHSTANC